MATLAAPVTDRAASTPAAARVTSSLFFLCLGVFVALAIATDAGNPDLVVSRVYRGPYDVWHGSYWFLITSSFLHFDLWHLLGNLYWLWLLGAAVERAIGATRFAAFVLTASFVGSAYQLAASDSTGCGASGIVYALAGFAWIARSRFGELRCVLSNQTVTLFIVWQLACFALTYTGALMVGNAAHLAGLVFGMLVGALATGWRPSLVIGCLGALVLFALLVVRWCPWSPTFVGGLAYDAHVAGDPREALRLYTDVLRLDPDNAWAYSNRSEVLAALGDADGANADLIRAKSLESTSPPSEENP